MHVEHHKGGIVLSSDPARLDINAILEFLSGTYWARHRPREIIEKSIRNSLGFGLYAGPRQIGFGRVVTDYATFAYIADVYVLPPWRGKGLARWLIESILSHPDLKDLRRWCLLTQDAHRLYQRCGFTPLKHPDHYLELVRPYAAPELATSQPNATRTAAPQP